MTHRSPSLMLCTAALLFLSSCGSNDSSTPAAGTDTTAVASATTNTPAPASTIVSTPTNMMAITHKVSNFNKWKMSYEGHDTARVANGIHNYVIGRSVEDSNNVFVALKIDDVDKAKAFGNAPGIKEAMQKGGVVGKPTIHFTTMVWQDTSMISAPLRSRTTFTVKNFDDWRKVFESQKQARTDNGLADRAFGYDMDNHNLVTVVVAVLDTAKARAFWGSDQLKKMREASGVTSTPQRFLYNVVQRY